MDRYKIDMTTFTSFKVGHIIKFDKTRYKIIEITENNHTIIVRKISDNLLNFDFGYNFPLNELSGAVNSITKDGSILKIIFYINSKYSLSYNDKICSRKVVIDKDSIINFKIGQLINIKFTDEAISRYEYWRIAFIDYQELSMIIYAKHKGDIIDLEIEACPTISISSQDDFDFKIIPTHPVMPPVVNIQFGNKYDCAKTLTLLNKIKPGNLVIINTDHLIRDNKDRNKNGFKKYICIYRKHFISDAKYKNMSVFSLNNTGILAYDDLDIIELQNKYGWINVPNKVITSIKTEDSDKFEQIVTDAHYFPDLLVVYWNNIYSEK